MTTSYHLIVMATTGLWGSGALVIPPGQSIWIPYFLTFPFTVILFPAPRLVD